MDSSNNNIFARKSRPQDLGKMCCMDVDFAKFPSPHMPFDGNRPIFYAFSLGTSVGLFNYFVPT